ncbi:MAG: beta-lactamase family protein [Planctomycetes bacterium]|nr:beta-lactamase family protein [Planctomycetota bacterium]
MRLSMAVIGLVAALCGGGVAVLGAPPADSGDAVDPVVAGAIGQQLDAHLKTIELKKGGFSGSALVAKEGRVLLLKGYGTADAKSRRPIPANALWDWASVSKQFTAAAVLKLQMQKKLRIDDSIRKIFPGAPRNKAGVTLRHLLNHTSGLSSRVEPRGVDMFDRDAVVKFILALPLESRPGKKWEYSNAAYFLLAAVVEKVSGRRFEQYVIEELFRPAGMKEACFIGSPGLDLERVPRQSRGTGAHFAYGERLSWGYRGSGGAVAPLAEMLQWDRALRGEEILDAGAKAEFYRPGLNDYALGWFVRQDRGGDVRYEHGGAVGDTATFYLRIMKADIVVALAYNTQPDLHPQFTAEALVQIARTGQPLR